MKLFYINWAFVILSSATMSPSVFAASDDVYDIPPVPIEVSGPSAGTIIGNNGDLFGGEFAKIIRVDVYERLAVMFAHNQIPSVHPLYVLKVKMAKFKALLDDKYRIYAVDPDDFHDVFGDDVLARVVPLRYTIRREGAEESLQRITTKTTVTHENFTKNGLVAFDSVILNRVTFKSDGTAIVRVGGDFIDSNNQPLPPGFNFYSRCSDAADLINAVRQAATSGQGIARMLCNGYRFDGAVATIDGTIEVTEDTAKNSLNFKADLSIQLEFQSYVIEVNRPQFVKYLHERGQKEMQILVFHEYLRLLGVDDQGYKLSAFARNLNDIASGKKVTLQTGDQVLIPKGVAIIATSDQATTLSATPESGLNPITYRGVVEKVLTQSYHIKQMPFILDGQQFYVVDAIVPRQVLKVRAIDRSSYVKPVQYFWHDDVTPYQLVIKD